MTAAVCKIGLILSVGENQLARAESIGFCVTVKNGLAVGIFHRHYFRLIRIVNIHGIALTVVQRHFFGLPVGDTSRKIIWQLPSCMFGKCNIMCKAIL